MSYQLTDRIKRSIEAFVTRLVSKYDYSGFCAYTVVAQNDDETLELRPVDDKKHPYLSKVEVMHDNPATHVKVKKGSECLVVFPNMSPDSPRVFGFRRGDYERFDVGEDTQAVARQGELVYSGGIGTMIYIVGPTPLAGGVPYPCYFGTVADPPSPAGDGFLVGCVMTASEKNFSA